MEAIVRPFCPMIFSKGNDMPAKKTDDQKPAPNKAKKKAPATPPKASPKKKALKNFPIVGLGASAGGLQALKTFFAQVAPNSGMAFIVVVHLPPKQPSIMAQLLQNVTVVPVNTAKDGERLEPDHIYIIPPDREISVFHGKIQLLQAVEKHSILPIDTFFRSLALDQGPWAVAVVLSGTGTDGTLGIKEIKAADGLVLVQAEESADYDGMPRSAINSGVVDIILPPEAMPQKLAQYFAHHKTVSKEKALAVSDQSAWLHKIFAILRAQIGHDFSQYKRNTLLRRIGRRMGLNQIQAPDQYVHFLRVNPNEVEALFREILIGVTNFFRDPASYEVLKSNVLPPLFDRIAEDGTFRAWIPGCSTGEELYSLAMVIREVLDKHPKRITIQLFGTDIDSIAIDKARAGLYPASIAADVSKEHLNRFFIKEGDFFRIRKEIRDWAVFSVQDLLKDPPFSRLQLLCCRNLLIYLNTEAQKKLLPLFHYTLLPEGVLILGASETIGGFANLFQVLDKKWKIFKRLEVPCELRRQVDFPSGLSTAEMGGTADRPAGADEPKANISLITQKAILEQFAPTALLVDAKGNILYIQGRTGKYLETPSGPPTHNILDMARQGLRIELSSALRAARSANRAEIRRRVSVKTNGDVQMINLHVRPLQMPRELAGRFLVVFEDVETALVQGAQAHDRENGTQESTRIPDLERELQSTRESHQTTIEELESSNEELKSTNEELQSSNEELQSTNEEQESRTSKNIITIEDAGPCKKKVLIEIPEESIKEAVDEQYKELAREAVVPGFRKGRAPRRLLEKRFGKETNEQIKLKLLAEASEAAIKDKELDILGDPDIDFEKVELPATGPMKFEFEAEVRPEFELPKLDGIPVKRPKLEVTDEQVTREIDQLRRWAGVWTPREDGKIEQDDQIIADVLLRPELTEEEKAKQAEQAQKAERGEEEEEEV